jgi:hypothetical protein
MLRRKVVSQLAGAKWLSILDLKICFEELGLHPGDKEKIAFSTT